MPEENRRDSKERSVSEAAKEDEREGMINTSQDIGDEMDQAKTAVSDKAKEVKENFRS